MNQVLLVAAIVMALGLGVGCLGEAPHDNPLDPLSPRFVEAGEVTGLVTDRAEVPLEGVEVRLIPGQGVAQPELVTRTDSRGVFSLSGVAPGTNYSLQATQEGYAAAMVETLDVRAGVALQLPALRLNALPSFTGMALRTVHISRWWPQNDQFFLEVDAQVSDADGLFDVESVWFDVPELGYTVVLDPQSAGRFDKRIQADSLPEASLQGLLGRTILLNVRDMEGGVVRSAPQQLVRVLEGTPTPTAPRDDVLLQTDQPALTWDPFSTGFAFTYRVDVFRAEVNRDVLVRQFPGIPTDITSLQLAPLPTGPYFWTLTVVDTFGNQSRSKEAAFRIP